MTSAHYSYRPHVFSRERSFWLEPNALGCSSGDEEDRLLFRDVEEVRLYRLFIPGEAKIEKRIAWRMHLRGHAGERVVLSPMHYGRFGHWEDRSRTYSQFSTELLAALQQANPSVKVTARQHWTMQLRRVAKRRLSALGGRLLFAFFRLVRYRDPDRTTNIAARAMRAIGPWLRGHRVARNNLVAAFPKKSAAQIDNILLGMWDNVGRAIVEYAFLDRLWDFSPDEAVRAAVEANARRIVIEPQDLARVRRIRESGRQALFFGAHLANWEMPAAAAAALGLNVAILYRPPDFALVAREIVDVRSRLMGILIPATAGAAAKLKSVLDRGMSVGMLVDEHAASGIEAIFFGRPCKVNPALAQIARRLDCAVHGTRAVRLRGGRFQIELTEALALPRDDHGKIDAVGATQMITSVIEGWIREHPEQWLWMRRRWR